MKQLTLIIALLVTGFLVAQDFQGVAIYKSHRKMDLNMEGEKENSELHKNLRAQLAKSFQKEYTLIFNREESIYKQNESLEMPTPNSYGITINASGGSDILYKNIKEKRYTNATEIFGKQFLIKDSIQNQKWEFVNETKNIGEYICNKAIFKETYKTQTGALEKVEKERETIAWYTMQIPVNNGPNNYNGLPGLILEINDGKLTLICSRIVLNPEEKAKIIEPKKGKLVTQDKFNEIQEKKNEEMMNQFKRRNKGKKSQSIIFQG